MNAYHLEIIADLKRKQDDVERNYRAARTEWERLKVEQRNLLESDPYGDDIVECSKNIRATFDYMMRLDDESTAIFTCYRAIEQNVA